MPGILIFCFSLISGLFAQHQIPPQNYGPHYLYPVIADGRHYKLPVEAGRQSYVSGGYCTDPHSGYRHADFAVDFDTPTNSYAICARAGKVIWMGHVGGRTDYYTIHIARADSVLDSASFRASGYTIIQTVDWYRHMIEGSNVVNIGDWVNQGDRVARVNQIAHVHFEVNVRPLTYVSPVDSTYIFTSIPMAFYEIRNRPEGMPELYDTYVSQNAPIRIEGGIKFSGLPGNGVSLASWPNPFKLETAVGLRLELPLSDVSLDIYDAGGRLVQNLLRAGKIHSPGFYALPWSASAQPAGRYVCLLRAGGMTVSRRLDKLE